MLWARYSKDWPSIERQASLHTGEIEFRGIPVDVDGIDQDITFLNTAENITRNRIPWIDTEDERGKPVALRSKKALDRECVKCGVPPPLTTAQKSKEFLDWVDEYGERVPAVIELGRYRRITRAIAIYKALKERIRKCDNRAAIGLKYGGADKTMRWSGSSKFNLQNLMKSPLMFTKDYLLTDNHNEVVNCVDIRSRFIASKGRKLIIADLSQIEPRVLNWVVGNNDFLELCRKGMSPYEAHARSSMGWVGGNLKKEDPKIYALAKARVLALGYGAGWGKFIEMARGYLASEDEFLAIFAIKPTQEAVDSFLNYLNKLSLKNHSGSKTALRIWPDLNQETQNIWVNAWSQVEHFRATNHKIKAYWNSLDSDFKRSVDTGIYECELPSKRTLKYFDVTPSHGWQCKPANPLGVVQKTYGGLLVENVIQSISRDIFCHGILKLEQAGYQVLFHVHDEVIVDATAETDPSDIIKLLTEVPEWAYNLPVTAEAEITTHYKK
jgi:DNA polymerase